MCDVNAGKYWVSHQEWSYWRCIYIPSPGVKQLLPCGGLSSVNHRFSFSGWLFFTSSSSSLRRMSFSVWKGTGGGIAWNTHTHEAHFDCNIEIRAMMLTWLANMSEHLVLSLGSAEILRMSCSIGVIPGGAEGELWWVGLMWLISFF